MVILIKRSYFKNSILVITFIPYKFWRFIKAANVSSTALNK